MSRVNIVSSSVGIAAIVLTTLAPHGAVAQSDPYRITSAEKAACTNDAIRLCSDAYPDENKLLSCMAENRASLTTGCAVVFEAGLKRRRLVSR